MLAGRVFQSFYVVEDAVVQGFDQRFHDGLYFGEIGHPSQSLIQITIQIHGEQVGVPVHPAAFVSFGNVGQEVR